MAAKKSKTGQKKVVSSEAKAASKRGAEASKGTGKSEAKPGAKKTARQPEAKSRANAAKAVLTRKAKAGTDRSSLDKKPATKLTNKATTPKPAARTKLVNQDNSVAKRSSAKARQTSSEALAVQVNDRATNAETSGVREALELGHRVPEFESLDQAGHKVSNRDWLGAPYVLYFYPKDDTPGCTTEACGFRDELPSFEELGVKVVGCSPDSPNAHTRFAQKYGLQFTLLADIEKDLAQLFGVWKLKQNYGREYMGVERSTFLIDKSGNMARQWRGVRVAGHVSDVLQAVRELP